MQSYRLSSGWKAGIAGAGSMIESGVTISGDNPTPTAGSAAASVFRSAFRLGCTAFGGPVAHLGYFQRTYVEQLEWLSTAEFSSIVALCQLLPGPASSQVGLLIGQHRAGWRGALAAWCGFTLPSACLMLLFALLSSRAHGTAFLAAIHGLMLTAVAVVAQALIGMARRLCPDLRRAAIALSAAALLLLHGGIESQLLAMLLGAVGGWMLCGSVQPGVAMPRSAISRRAALCALGIFIGLFFLLAAFGAPRRHDFIALAAVFYRSGALVFGGGHVVLPLLRDALVPSGWISDAGFLQGYGFAQAIPGPLFTLAAYLGAACAPNGLKVAWAGGSVLALFLPGMLLALAAAPLLELVRARNAWPALAGINAAVVGILAAALYKPVCTTSIGNSADAAIAAVGAVLLVRFRMPPVLVAALCVAVSIVLARLRAPA